ncbi:flagellar hook-length control protein FliK [Bacillus salipaludis]|uniref:Flagellar hook-length control protein FliK n=1 Tax=Bacillus salipaludis TaxID=2547811 RepID=A0ABW8RE69_9BACI
MDITQFPIKINQTNASDGGKANTLSQEGDLASSFDQRLEMFNFGDKSKNFDRQSASSFQNMSDKDESDEITPKTLQEEEWLQLDSILSALLASIPQIPNIKPNDSVQPVEFTMLDQFHLVPTDLNKSMSQLLQDMNGFNQTSTLDTNELIQGFAHLFSKWQLLEEQKSFEIPNQIKDKIQLFLDEIHNDNNLDISTLVKTDLQKKELFFTVNKQDSAIVKPWLSLDKNQVMGSFVTETETNSKGRSNFVREPLTIPVEDHTIINGQMLLRNHQVQAPESLIVPKTDSSVPQLHVSEFAPEVSKWISGNMRITNGLSGSTEVKFSLFPEHLGHIEIKINSFQGLISAQILTETSMAKEALEGQLQQLKQSLLQHGIVVQKLDIVQQTPVSTDIYQANQSLFQGDSSSSHKQRTTPEQELAKKQEDHDQKDIETEPLSFTYGGATPKITSTIDFTA